MGGKPAPDLILHAAAACSDVAPDECLVIEDSPAGVAAAVSAGMEVIGFTGGKHARESLRQRLAASGATRIVDQPSEIANLITAP